MAFAMRLPLIRTLEEPTSPGIGANAASGLFPLTSDPGELTAPRALTVFTFIKGTPLRYRQEISSPNLSTIPVCGKTVFLDRAPTELEHGGKDIEFLGKHRKQGFMGHGTPGTG